MVLEGHHAVVSRREDRHVPSARVLNRIGVREKDDEPSAQGCKRHLARGRRESLRQGGGQKFTDHGRRRRGDVEKKNMYVPQSRRANDVGDLYRALDRIGYLRHQQRQ